MICTKWVVMSIRKLSFSFESGARISKVGVELSSSGINTTLDGCNISVERKVVLGSYVFVFSANTTGFFQD